MCYFSGVIDAHKYGDYIDELCNEILKRDFNAENQPIYRSLN